MNYKTNLKKSEFDIRDYIFKGQQTKEILKIESFNIPQSLDYRKDLMPIRNQGSQGTCYAQSAACMKEWQERKDIGFNKYFSPQFFYNNRSNKYDDNSENDDGMNGRDVMKLLKNIGICEEDDYKYGRIEDKSSIETGLYLKARKNCIKSYAKIENMDELKLSLYNNGPCLIGMPVYNYSGQLWKKKDGETFLGGHAMVIVGYNNEGFIIRNSWGINWGDEGYSIYKYEDWGVHWEIWTTIDEKNGDIIVPGEEDKEEEKREEEEKEDENKVEEDKEEEYKTKCWCFPSFIKFH